MHACFAWQAPWHRTWRLLNERQGSKKRRCLSTRQAAEHFKIEQSAVSASTSAVRHGAIPVPRLKVEVPTKAFEALSIDFAEEHRVQWNTFVKKIGEDDLTDSFVTVVAKIEAFAMPLFLPLAHGGTIARQWKAGIGWVN